MWLPVWLLCVVCPKYNCNRCGSQTGIPTYVLWLAGFGFLVLCMVYGIMHQPSGQ